ncbi:DUF6463 family protein [Agarilytica rhodophyticola]|uniref:DUF6463 family protein n=1 Tax=Agarilytica rhodophyticola TaxID=1737490 RepID=UPI000B3436FB|nr:DUF6463 family protein [Agarilytica rhodophyticola]
MKWIGYWLMTVATLHTILAVFLYGTIYTEWLQTGLVGSIQSDAHRLGLWFLVSGFLIFTLGTCLLHIPSPPLSIGILLLLIAFLGLALLPKSGFWFLLPPALAIIFKRPAAPN